MLLQSSSSTLMQFSATEKVQYTQSEYGQKAKSKLFFKNVVAADEQQVGRITDIGGVDGRH